MNDLNELRQRISRAMGQSNLRLQTDVISTLLSEVDQFIDSLLEDQKIVGSISDLKRQLETAKRDPDQLEAVKEVETLLRQAQSLERSMSEKRDALRRLRDNLELLRHKIIRGIN